MKKVSAIKALTEVEAESNAMTPAERYSLEMVVQARLQTEGLILALDSAIAAKGIALARSITSIDEWLTLTVGRKNLAPAEKSGVNVNVSQGNTNQATVLPLPSPRANETMRRVLRGEFAGDDE